MNALSTELRINGVTQLFALAAIAAFAVFVVQGETAWASLLVVLVVVFGGFGLVRALFLPHERVLPALGAWLLLTLTFVPVLLFAWYAARPAVSLGAVLLPTAAGLAAFIPRLLVFVVRRAK